MTCDIQTVHGRDIGRASPTDLASIPIHPLAPIQFPTMRSYSGAADHRAPVFTSVVLDGLLVVARFMSLAPPYLVVLAMRFLYLAMSVDTRVMISDAASMICPGSNPAAAMSLKKDFANILATRAGARVPSVRLVMTSFSSRAKLNCATLDRINVCNRSTCTDFPIKVATISANTKWDSLKGAESGRLERFITPITWFFTATGVQMKLAPRLLRSRAIGANLDCWMSAISSGLPRSKTHPAIESPRPGLSFQAEGGSVSVEHHNLRRGTLASPSDSSMIEQLAASVTDAARSTSSPRWVPRFSSALRNTAKSCRRPSSFSLTGFSHDVAQSLRPPLWLTEYLSLSG